MTNKVLRVKLDVPVECRFTKSDAFNGLPTYPIPPVTTVRGLCYAALNRPSLLNQDRKPYRTDKDTVDKEREFRENFSESTRISVQPKTNTEEQMQTDLRNRMKVGRSEDDKAYRTYVVQEQSIISPVFVVYIEFSDDTLKESVKSALEDPERLLYLGHSDDLVEVSVDELEYEEDQETSGSIYAPIEDESTVQDPILLPVESDYKGTYSTRPARSQLIGKQKNVEANKLEFEGEEEFFAFFD